MKTVHVHEVGRNPWLGRYVGGGVKEVERAPVLTNPRLRDSRYQVDVPTQLTMTLCLNKERPGNNLENI